MDVLNHSSVANDDPTAAGCVVRASPLEVPVKVAEPFASLTSASSVVVLTPLLMTALLLPARSVPPTALLVPRRQYRLALSSSTLVA